MPRTALLADRVRHRQRKSSTASKPCQCHWSRLESRRRCVFTTFSSGTSRYTRSSRSSSFMRRDDLQKITATGALQTSRQPYRNTSFARSSACTCRPGRRIGGRAPASSTMRSPQAPCTTPVRHRRGLSLGNFPHLLPVARSEHAPLWSSSVRGRHHRRTGRPCCWRPRSSPHVELARSSGILRRTCSGPLRACFRISPAKQQDASWSFFR